MLVAKITDGENFRFRVPAELKRKWVEMCVARKISQQDAITALMTFTTVQEPLTQAMLLGQQPAHNDLVEVVLRRLGVGRVGQKGKPGDKADQQHATPPGRERVRDAK